jgi:acetyl-CoA/propionyl-CoA carboxylase, biotin carboxylase, biotin carboxyl carrier protein
MLDSVLVANRGEIAVRIIRTLRRLGVRSIAVFSDADADAPHVRVADAAVRLGPAPAVDSYLRGDRIVAAARATGAQAIHPGYGFLSESADFAREVLDAELGWIGPPASAIESMGDKIRAKQTVEAAGVPVVPGVHEPGMDDAALIAAAADVGYPLMVKAAAGGGGKGMRVVHDPADLEAAIAAARREARGGFGDDTLLLERFVTAPRHIEIQVLRDVHGTGVALGERECSLQRRHQKIIEEAPSPLLDDATRTAMAEAAIAAAHACDYVGAGTVELIVSGHDPSDFFFLEMNTRLQVEHPVTELVWGLDLVEWQLRIADGEPIDVLYNCRPSGHAIEARVYAEDPGRGFLPTGGTILVAAQDAAGARVDTGVADGSVVGSDYDPMLAKVIVHGEDRAEALHRLDRALADYHLLGVTTNVAFLRALLADPGVRAGDLDTGLVDRLVDALVEDEVPDEILVAAALARVVALEPSDAGLVDPFDLPGGWRVAEPAWTTWRMIPAGGRGGDPIDVRIRGRSVDAELAIGDAPPLRASAALHGDRLTVWIGDARLELVYAEDDDIAWLGAGGSTWAVREEEQLTAARQHQEEAGGPLVAPMPGTVTIVHVEEGDAVQAGQALLVVEAMKMEHPIVAPVDGVVSALPVRAGQQVAMEERLVVITPTEPDGAEAANPMESSPDDPTEPIAAEEG